MTTDPLVSMGPTLKVDRLSINYGDADNPFRAIRDVSFAIRPGEAYGLIGESGSGKTTIAFSIMDYRNGSTVAGGRIELNECCIQGLNREELRKLRGNRVAMVYQDPANSLNPGIKISEQIAEILRQHLNMNRADALAKAVKLLGQVHLPDPVGIAERYPHQLSGGQQQRVVIAMALACEPDLLILDEPTTGLDVTTEAVILDLVKELRERTNASILFISHNIAVIAKVCDRVGVLYAGELVEEGPCNEVIHNPKHPYTLGLISAMPSSAQQGSRLNSIGGSLPDLKIIPDKCIFEERCSIVTKKCREAKPQAVQVGEEHLARCIRTKDVLTANPQAPTNCNENEAAVESSGQAILQTSGLTHLYRSRTQLSVFKRSPSVRAVHDVSLDIEAGRTLAIVGESGSGKSTLARCIIGLISPTEGSVSLGGDILKQTASRRKLEEQRRIQFIFQDPTGALNPRFTVEEIISRPLRLYGRSKGKNPRDRVIELMDSVNLPERFLERYSHELSGGEKQRVSIARVLGAEPDLILCDEPTSALDISVQAAVLNELSDLQSRFHISYLFISHDLGVVRYIADRVAIMYLGAIVEVGQTEKVFGLPHHPYTVSLISALPTLHSSLDRPEIRLAGAPPTPGEKFEGCPFASRCPRKVGALCNEQVPPVQQLESGRTLSCHIPIDELAEMQRI